MTVLLPILFMLGSASAQYLIESLSFGHKETISPNNNGVPGWRLLPENQPPALLSDKIILTPPYPGNRRGAVWADASNTKSEWKFNFDFRASGPERGGGNLQLWYTKDGRASVDTASIYTVGKFDGLALVIDTYGGKGGSIRGFMNDGGTDYRNHHAVDSLAFGHCDYAYRNLGRPSQISVRQEANTFGVDVDGRQCFSSDKIKLPSDYYFGITAASADTPDTFEVYKFVTTTSSSIAREEPRRNQPPPPLQQEQQYQQPPAYQQAQQPADTHASQYASQAAQFEDLHNRLQTMAHAIENIQQAVSKLTGDSEGRHREISRNVMSADQLKAMDSRIQGIEKTVGDYRKEFSSLQAIFKDSHGNLMQSLPAHMTDIIHTKTPRVGLFLFIVVAFQALLAGSYIIYKRRRAQGPKKYL